MNVIMIIIQELYSTKSLHSAMRADSIVTCDELFSHLKGHKIQSFFQAIPRMKRVYIMWFQLMMQSDFTDPLKGKDIFSSRSHPPPTSLYLPRIPRHQLHLSIMSPCSVQPHRFQCGWGCLERLEAKMYGRWEFSSPSKVHRTIYTINKSEATFLDNEKKICNQFHTSLG